MMFSIAIPVLGMQRFLPTALLSLIAQRVPMEVAMLDATPDDSIQQLIAGHDVQFAYRRHGADDGQAAAIDEGWRNTRGDILAWLCADDYYFPGTLESVAEVFRQDPGVDVVYGYSVFVDEEGRFLRYFPSISDDVRRILFDCCISQPACFVRRQAVDDVGGIDTLLEYVMDWDLWIRLYRAGKRFARIEQPLAAVRMYPGTKTSSRSPRRYAEIAELLNRHAPWHRALRSRLGFYLHDLLQEPHALGRAAGLLVKAKRSLLGGGAGSLRSLYGFELASGVALGRATVHLPWFGASPPNIVAMETLGCERLELRVNGRPCESCRDPAPAQPQRWAGAIQFDPGSSLEIELWDAHPGWRLLRLTLAQAESR